MQFGLESLRECVQMTVAIAAILRLREEKRGHDPDRCRCSVGLSLRLYEGAMEYLLDLEKELDVNQRLP